MTLRCLLRAPAPEAAMRPPVGVADWLSLAAAPTFAIMALLTCSRQGPLDMLCSAGP